LDSTNDFLVAAVQDTLD